MPIDSLLHGDSLVRSLGRDVEYIPARGGRPLTIRAIIDYTLEKMYSDAGTQWTRYSGYIKVLESLPVDFDTIFVYNGIQFSVDEETEGAIRIDNGLTSIRIYADTDPSVQQPGYRRTNE